MTSIAPQDIALEPGSTPKPLTQRQTKILTFVQAFIAKNGWAPSVREIGNAVGLNSTSSVAYQLKVLEARGYLKFPAASTRKARAFFVVSRSVCPLCGSSVSSRVATER